MRSRDVRHRVDPLPVLSDGRVRLRRILVADVPDIVEISVYDGALAADEAEAAAILARIDRDMEAGLGLHWGICEGDRDEVLGSCGFCRGYPDNVGEVGYALRAAHRGRGLMTAAVRLVAAFGFVTLGLAGVVAYTDPGNRASQAVLERAGFHPVPWQGRDRKFGLEPPAPGRMPAPWAPPRG